MESYDGCHMYSEHDQEIIKPAVDVFEIEDYTAATEWEDFTDQLENILRGWKLSTGSEREVSASVPLDKSKKCDWRAQTANLQYINFPFLVKYYRYGPVDTVDTHATTADHQEETKTEQTDDSLSSHSRVMEDISQGTFDFVSDAKPIPLTMFGLTEMIIVSPSGSEMLSNETRANQILGSINIALQNTGASVPVLIQVMDPKNHLYIGSSICDNCRMEFSSVRLNKKPQHVSHLSGLLQLFRNRISSPLPVDVSSASVSVRLSYQLEDWASYAWCVDPPDLDLYNVSGDTDFVQLKEMPLGCVSDPIAGLTLHTTWRDLNEDLIVDNSVHSDLDPLEAPEWSIGVTLQTFPECLLAKHVRGVVELCRDKRTSKDVLKDYNLDQDSSSGVVSGAQEAENVAGLFDKLSGPEPSNISVGGTISGIAKQVRPLKAQKGGPLSSNLLEYVLGYLFPDAGSQHNAYHKYSNSDRSEDILEYASTTVKSCPYDGLVWRLSTSVACCLAWAGAEGVSHLMHEFLLEARFRWENGVSLPGLPPGSPHTGTSLIHQKLQMLNCCIAKRKTKDNSSKEKFESVTRDTAAANDSDDEFFDCEGEKSNDESCEEETPLAWEKAEGRVDRVGDLKLLNGKNFMYRPHLQEPAPMTEDQVAEQADVLMQLGSDVAGSEVRAKLQSANLLSDMESFKAANPGCELADFVRWHSPRDWDEANGLSSRMKASGNMWKNLWEQARAVPAHRQKRLFDETREAEKVLQFLTNLGPGDLAQLILPTLLQAAHIRILSSDENMECSSNNVLIDLHTQMIKLTCSVSKTISAPEIRHYRGNIILQEYTTREDKAWQALECLNRVELHISRYMSLRKKFVYDLNVAEYEIKEDEDALSEMSRFVHSLCQEGAEVKVPGAARGPAGRLIQAIFRESAQDSEPRPSGLPHPRVRQFVLKCLAGRPLPSSRPTPQRLYAKFAPYEFRLNGVYTLDRQYL